jgi:hypothetical protein
MVIAGERGWCAIESYKIVFNSRCAKLQGYANTSYAVGQIVGEYYFEMNPEFNILYT